MHRNIVLTGFMGSGKTLVSKHLAERTGRKVLETDEMIVELEGKPVTEIFSESGEIHFRKVEKQVVLELSKRDNIIIDCGGGVVLDKENIAALREKGVVIYLSASPKEIYRRIKDQKHRPLLNVEDPAGRILELFKKREPYYAQADCVVDTDGKSVAQVCDEVLDLMEKFD